VIVDDKSKKDASAGSVTRMRLVCPVCGRSVPFTEAELLESVHRGLPQCCGEPMTIDRGPPGGERKPPVVDDETGPTP
jgi:hypothetical protein